MRKRSQIFLLLTILVITFIVGIATTLLESQRTQYTDPLQTLPNFTQTWDNTVGDIQDALILTLAARSDGTIANTSVATDNTIDGYFLQIMEFLRLKGFSASITLENTIVDGLDYLHHSNAAGPSKTTEGFEFRNIEVNFELQSSTTVLSQKLFFDISYTSIVDSAAGTITLYKVINGERTGLTNAEFTITGGATVTQTFAGQYTYTGTGTTDIRVLDGILFSALVLA
jgi:hypothetical protein